jgi:hypothetical protein
MFNNLDFEKILFLDIETVPMVQDYDRLPEKFQKLWDKKSFYLKKEEGDTPDSLFARAGIYAEFGKIVCISVGYMHNREFRLKSFYGDDEIELLKEFAEMLKRYYNLL